MALNYANTGASDAAPPVPQGAVLSFTETAQLAGIKYPSVMAAIKRGALHPVHIPWMRRAGIFRREAEAYRDKYAYIPTTVELTWLMREGYPREAFRTYEEARQEGVQMNAGALVSSADVLAYVQGLTDSMTAGMANVGGTVAERGMRPFADVVRDGVPLDAQTLQSVGGVAREMAEGAVRPLAEVMRDSIAPITASLAEASRVVNVPPTTRVERELATFRVEMAQLMNRIVGSWRPIAERLAEGGVITPEDEAPFLALAGELAENYRSLGSEKLYQNARQIVDELPGMLHPPAGAPQGAQTPRDK